MSRDIELTSPALSWEPQAHLAPECWSGGSSLVVLTSGLFWTQKYGRV